MLRVPMRRQRRPALLDGMQSPGAAMLRVLQPAMGRLG